MGAATDVADRRAASSESTTALWAGVLAGPIAWSADLLASYALVKWTCGHQHLVVLHLITLGALVVIAGGAFASWRALATAPRQATPMGGRPVDRARFMAILGLTSSALFAVAVLALAVPEWMIDACL